MGAALSELDGGRQLDAPRCVPGAEAHHHHPSTTQASSRSQSAPSTTASVIWPPLSSSPPPCKTTHNAMDSLVAQYSQAPHQNEGYGQDEQQELMEVTPPLSLKFALPPVAAVRPYSPPHDPASRHTDGLVSLHHGSAP